MNQLWNYCSFCGKRIETGEKCYGLPNGESVCTDCCVAENEGAAGAEKEKLECTMMTNADLAAAMLRLVCLGCGYEHDCGIHGCALLREASDRIKRMDKQLREYGDCHTCVHDKPCGYDDITCVACERSENWEWGVQNG